MRQMTALIEAFGSIADAISDLADALEAKTVQLVSPPAEAKIQAIGTALSDGGDVNTIFNDLSTACPENRKPRVAETFETRPG